MRIGIDAQFLEPRGKGLGRYTENLIKELRNIDRDNQYFIFSGKETRGLKRHLLLPFKLKKHRLDLVHFTHYNVPIFYKENFIVTIHDLIPRDFPKFKKFFNRLILKLAIKRAKKIIAVSEYTKKEILKYYKVNPDKIKVIYEGIF